jgi:amino acid transporter
MGDRTNVSNALQAAKQIVSGLTANSTFAIPLTNGGTGGAIFVFLGTAVGMGFVITSMAEMASMYVPNLRYHIKIHSTYDEIF